MNSENQNVPEYVNVSTMAKMLGLSRSRLYQLIEQGILLKPICSEQSKRPVYSREIILRNLEVKKNNVGINGQIVMFYSQRSQRKLKSAAILPKKSTKQRPIQNEYKAIIEDLELLELSNIKASDVASAIGICFPDGTADVSEDETLTAVFRHLKRQNTEYKPRA